jgi:hypothetical protein
MSNAEGIINIVSAGCVGEENAIPDGWNVILLSLMATKISDGIHS